MASTEMRAWDERDRLGMIVCDAWVAWAREQSDPKPSWLVSWDDLNERDREVDRRIGEAVAADQAQTIALLTERDEQRTGTISDALVTQVERLERVLRKALCPDCEWSLATRPHQWDKDRDALLSPVTEGEP